VGEQASQGGEERPIGRPQRRSARLPAKHGQLVPQHEQLDVFGELAPPAPNEQPQHGREREIGEKKATSADAPRTDRQPQKTDEPWF
jgi:hypothetical protein